MRNSRGVRQILLVFMATALILPQAMAPSPAVGQQGLDFEKIAIDYVRAHAADYGLDADDVAEIRVSARYTSQHNRVTHVYLRQQRGGIDVQDANATVNIDRHGEVLFVGMRFVPLPPPTGTATLTAVEAAEAAAAELGIKADANVRVLESSNGVARASELSRGGISASKIPAKLVYEVVGGKLVLAWNVEIEEISFDHWWSANVNAETGELLSKVDYIDHDTANKVALSLATSAGISSSAVASALAPAPGKGTGVGDGSSYNVFEHPKESPLDGPRTIVDDPAHFVASPYGWHDTDGEAGPEFTVTRGNNAHAYTDIDNNNLPDAGSDPDGGPGLDFSHPVDFTQHPHTYSNAAVTNLFYWNNIIHDLTHEYGFTEEAGNFQVNNYGRGGLGNDDVRAEAQDGAGMNNANFGTGAEGQRPRMQMFLWQHGRPYTVTIDPPSSAAGSYQAAGANFGPALNLTGVSGSVALVNDGTGLSPTDACEPLVGFPAGSIALLDRGNCDFVVKVKNAQNAGATAAIVASNVAGNPTTMGGTDATITIPSVMVSQAAGVTIKAGLPANGKIALDPARSVNRDGDFDAGIIAHEYGHGISNRLTGGPATTGCLSGQEQMGEGWSDFMAVVLTGMASDNRQSRGVGNYALYNDVGRSGPGIRPAPYSTSMTINPATYDTIKTAAVPHGVGYTWNSMLWEVYWNLIDKHGFNPDLYDETGGGGNVLTLQLIMDGMKFQACDPGFVDGRDAILAADQALTDGDNQCEIWAGFSKRGLGFSAVQGSSASRSDGTQAFDTHPDCAPSADVDPNSISRSMREGHTPSTNLRISNTASRDADDLEWSINETTSDCATPSDLSWVTLSATSGSTPGGRHTNVKVTFNSVGISPPATVTGKLCIATNDAANPVIEVPLTLQVRD